MTLPCWPSSLLGTPLANAHGQRNQNLTVRYSGREDEIDRNLFREGIGTRLIFLHPPLLSDRFKRRRKFSLKRPQIERCLVNGNLPIVPAILYERSNNCIKCPHPPFPQDRTGYRPSNLVDLESDKFIMSLATDKARVLGDLLE